MASASQLVPRVYQHEAASRALQQNTVVRADTGSGKTLIAILLIRRVLSRPTTDRSLVVFTTPTTTLVAQQAAVVREQTTAKVKAFIGAEVEFWKRERWQEEIAQADVVVCTPQVWLNVLGSGYFRLRDCALLIMNECHHCTKKHPSAEIMRQHYHPAKLSDAEHVPKIFGMTASPLWNAKTPTKAIADLEALLDARILEVQAVHSAEVKQYTPKASEVLVEFETGGDLSTISRELDAARVLSEEVETRSLPTVDKLSPRVTALIDVLRPYEAHSGFHGIVFVEQRVHAIQLAELLVQQDSFADWLRPAALVGHGRSGWKEEDDGERERRLGMEVKEQQNIVARFRTGELNLLIATQVAEEGLDFRACNLVVRFDALKTVTGYIQSRGRARAADARFVVLAARDSIDASKYREYVEQEIALQQLYAGRPADDELPEPELDDLPTFTTDKGALLTHQSAISTLAGFCQLIRVDEYTPLQKPEFVVSGAGVSWVAELQVPKTAALYEHHFVSSRLPTRRAAKQNAAFQACLALHAAGVLDDHLLPLRPSRSVDAKDADGNALDRSTVPAVVQLELLNPFGNVWNSAESRICHRRRTLYDPDGGALEVLLLSRRTLIWPGDVGREQCLAALEKLNRDLSRIVLNRRVGEERFYALWAPVDASGEIDWPRVTAPFAPVRTDQLAAGDIVALPQLRTTTRLGTFSRVRSDVTSGSPTSDIETSPSKKKQKLVERCTKYGHYLRTMYGDAAGEVGETEPIIAMEPIEFELHNALVSTRVATGASTSDVSAETAPSSRFFPLSLLRSTSLPLSFFRAFSYVPSLNRHFMEHAAIHALRATIDLPAIDDAPLRTALTAPNSQTGYDYQTLEFIGDAALQLATSVHVFLRHPKADEEHLSVMRANSVDNRFLRRLSLDRELSRFLLLHPHRPTTYVPEMSDAVTVSADGLALTRTAGRRVLSDTLEALLGAAVTSGGFGTLLHAAASLSLCAGGREDWNTRSNARALFDVPPRAAGPGMYALEAALGHTFRTQGDLLRQALTHRSWMENAACYERLEFLGDAILEWWATDRLFALSRTAPPSQLTFARALLVSSGALALVGLRKLELHKSILHSSPALERALVVAADEAQTFTWQQVVDGDLTFLWMPPKVVSDVVEALLAAIFIDAKFHLEPVLYVLDRLFADIMPLVVLSTEVRDPYSRLLMLAGSLGCSRLTVTVAFEEGSGGPYVATCTFHDEIIASISNSAKSVARQLAAKAALEQLAQPDIVACCGCKAERAAAAAAAVAAGASPSEVPTVDGNASPFNAAETTEPSTLIPTAPFPSDAHDADAISEDASDANAISGDANDANAMSED